MKKLFVILLSASIFAACNQNSGNSAQTDSTANQGGKPAVVALKDFEKEASKYVGKEIQVSGIADHVCKHGGKRLFMVADGADLHVESDTRFDEAIAGSSVTVTGIVEELRIDEAYLLKMEEDNIKSHKNKEISPEDLEQKKENIKYYRDSMKTANVDHLSFYSLKYVSHSVDKTDGEAKK
jgi:hypothetical protein